MDQERDESFGRFMKENSVVVGDPLYQFDRESYDEFLSKRPWREK